MFSGGIEKQHQAVMGWQIKSVKRDESYLSTVPNNKDWAKIFPQCEGNTCITHKIGNLVKSY